MVECEVQGESPPTDSLSSASSLRLVQALLDEQQTMTAIDRFEQAHRAGGAPTSAHIYRDLIPATLPGSGEQYAFEVDLDSCSGCKACVTACHALNGLEEDEAWRSVGQLVGGTSELPVIQHVTTACHHCVEPACLSGCPVEAYEKDPLTGIVRHLDDQCIGCQYCVLTCPYDVPVYSKSKGIVRKCDMCQQRLSVSEAPACVQSCPNRAIRIRTVRTETVLEECEANSFVPTAPDPGHTVPTTSYKTARPQPRNLLPADYYCVQRLHGHVPLVVMLVLTQMSVGVFLVDQLMYWYFSQFQLEIAQSVRTLHLMVALTMGLLGLAASVFHLGRPFYAYRAVLGLRTSWLSREILAFGIFAATASLYVGSACLAPLKWDVSAHWEVTSGIIASAAGLLAVACSVMIYVSTRRPCWTVVSTGAKFFLTGLILGIPATLLVSIIATATMDNITVAMIMQEYGRALLGGLLITVVIKLIIELSALTALRQRQHTPHKRSALLLTGQLGMITARRFFFGLFGGVVLPAILLAESTITSDRYHPLFIGLATLFAFGLLVAGELMERYLFFAASVAAKMPGSAAT